MTDYAGYLSGGNNEFAVRTAVFADNAPEIEVIELSQSTATVALAAAAIVWNRDKSPKPYL